MPHAVKGFFENGGKRAFICRIVNKPSTVATAYFNDLKVVAVGAGSWGNQFFVEIKASTARIPIRTIRGNRSRWGSAFRPRIGIRYPRDFPL